jgi:hypothetical protein
VLAGTRWSWWALGTGLYGCRPIIALRSERTGPTEPLRLTDRDVVVAPIRLLAAFAADRSCRPYSPRWCENYACTLCATVGGLLAGDRALATSVCGCGSLRTRITTPVCWRSERRRHRQPPREHAGLSPTRSRSWQSTCPAGPRRGIPCAGESDRAAPIGSDPARSKGDEALASGWWRCEAKAISANSRLWARETGAYLALHCLLGTAPLGVDGSSRVCAHAVGGSHLNRSCRRGDRLPPRATSDRRRARDRKPRSSRARCARRDRRSPRNLKQGFHRFIVLRAAGLPTTLI